MSDAHESRSGAGGIIVGVFLLLIAPVSLLITLAFVRDGGDFTERPNGGGAIQWALTSAWLLTTGILLLKRAPAARFVASAGLAGLAGLVGLVTWLPLSFGNIDQEAIDARWDPLGFVAWSAAAALAGLGHALQVKGSRRAKLVHVLALVVAVLGVLYVVERHA